MATSTQAPTQPPPVRDEPKVRIFHPTFGYGYAVSKAPGSYGDPHVVCRWDRGLFTRTPTAEIKKVKETS